MLIFKNYKLLSSQEHQELLAIRNAAEIRDVSKDKSFISLENHLKWVLNINSSQCYAALFFEKSIIGGLNYSAKGESIENWGIFFNKTIQPLISSMATYLFIEFMFEKYEVLYSEVLKENQKALKFNQYFGINVVEEKERLYRLKLTKQEWNESKKSLKILEKRVKKISYKFEC